MKIFVAIAISVCAVAPSAPGQTSKDEGAIRIMRAGSQPSRQGPAENFTGGPRDRARNASIEANRQAGRRGGCGRVLGFG